MNSSTGWWYQFSIIACDMGIYFRPEGRDQYNRSHNLFFLLQNMIFIAVGANKTEKVPDFFEILISLIFE